MRTPEYGINALGRCLDDRLVYISRDIVKLSQTLVSLGIDVLSRKEVRVRTRIHGAVDIILVALPTMLPSIQVVSHAKYPVIHRLVDPKAFEKRRVLNGNQLPVVGGTSKVDDADTAQMSLILGGLNHTVDGRLEETARHALGGFTKIDDQSLGLVLDPAVLAVVVVEDLQRRDGL